MNQREYVESMRAYEHKKLRELKKKYQIYLEQITKSIKMAGRSTRTWGKQAVKISYDGSERRPEVWLIIHAIIYKVC